MPHGVVAPAQSTRQTNPMFTRPSWMLHPTPPYFPAGKDAGVDVESFHADWTEREMPLERGALVLCARTAKGSDTCARLEESLAHRRRDVGKGLGFRV